MSCNIFPQKKTLDLICFNMIHISRFILYKSRLPHDTWLGSTLTIPLMSAWSLFSISNSRTILKCGYSSWLICHYLLGITKIILFYLILKCGYSSWLICHYLLGITKIILFHLTFVVKLQVHDRAQWFIAPNPGNQHGTPTYAGEIQRWSKSPLIISNSISILGSQLLILVSYNQPLREYATLCIPCYLQFV